MWTCFPVLFQALCRPAPQIPASPTWTAAAAGTLLPTPSSGPDSNRTSITTKVRLCLHKCFPSLPPLPRKNCESCGERTVIAVHFFFFIICSPYVRTDGIEYQNVSTRVRLFAKKKCTKSELLNSRFGLKNLSRKFDGFNKQIRNIFDVKWNRIHFHTRV